MRNTVYTRHSEAIRKSITTKKALERENLKLKAQEIKVQALQAQVLLAIAQEQKAAIAAMDESQRRRAGQIGRSVW